MTQSIVIGLVEYEGRFVFMQRADMTWTFPSGKVEAGETKEKAVVREILEETGSSAEVVEFLGDRQIGETSLYYYLCRTASEGLTLREPDKFLSLQWVMSQEILKTAGENLFQPIKTMMLSRAKSIPDVPRGLDL